MKRLSTIMVCLFAMMVTSLSAKAQEVTITLYPGVTWISYPKAEMMDITTALGDFVPMEGDVIKSQYGYSTFVNGYWRGSVTHFMPGWGYMYYSNRTEVVSFVFGETAPQLTVTTAEPTEITAISAVSGGSITSNDGSYVFVLEKGICWATHPNPTVMNDFHTENGNGYESFTASMINMTPNSVYYVRAFVVTLNGTVYGNEISFTTSLLPVGALNGLFSVSDSRQVYFSQGNLQYIGSASAPYWKFAENQWDYFGTTTGQNCSNQNVDRDVFGWGTSGWDNGNIYYHPWDTDNSDGSLYGPPGIYDLTGDCANADWGVYNSISNGGNQPNMWRTLSADEWLYVFRTRTTDSGIRFALARVNNVRGYVLLPDNWKSSNYLLNEPNDTGADDNIITVEDWLTYFEINGAVFLPYVNLRNGISLYDNPNWFYWSSSSCDTNGYTNGYAKCIGFLLNYGGSYSPRSQGLPVRLIRDVK
jgi:hypothetical protein